MIHFWIADECGMRLVSPSSACETTWLAVSQPEVSETITFLIPDGAVFDSSRDRVHRQRARWKWRQLQDRGPIGGQQVGIVLDESCD